MAEKESKNTHTQNSWLKTIGIWIVCVGGIYCCFMFNSYMKELILKGKANKAKLIGESVMLLIQSLFILVVGFILHRILGPKNESYNLLDKNVALSGLFAFGSVFCSFRAIKEMNFVLQIMIKSSKCLTVLVTAFIINDPKYKKKVQLSSLVFGIVIFAGLITFNLNSLLKGKPETSTVGLLWALGSLICDGMTAHNQNIIRGTFNPSSFAFMTFTGFHLTAWSLVFSVAQGQIQPALDLFQSEQGVLNQIVSMSGSSVLGNLFIYITISLLGPVNLSLITTTRKIFSIFFSIIINGHILDQFKIIGISLVVLGILLEMVWKMRGGKSKPEDKKVKGE